MSKVLVVLSGGMDSTTLAYLAARHDPAFSVSAVSFDYSQRHKTELRYAMATAAALGIKHRILPVPALGMLGGSALTDDDHAVPDGHYADPTMRQTIVPNRNAVLLSLAVAAAVVDGADLVWTGVHAGDHPVYPDCRPEFIQAFDRMAVYATGKAVEGVECPSFVQAPFVGIDKAAICRLGDTLGVPWLDTWSCYKGGDVHCGTCGTCYERREAFQLAGVTDPTSYLAEPALA